ncbi:MAG: hypothetical protein ACYTE8_09105 [Planctomycetota bacterium]|jgi:hypothetical protein
MKYPTEGVPDEYLRAYNQVVGALAEVVSPLFKKLGDVYDPVFLGTDDDITTIGYIYYHDLEFLIEKSILEKGAVLVLGYALVNQHGFKWEVKNDEQGNAIFMITHQKLEKPLVLTPDAIRSTFSVEDEGEEPAFSEYIDEAWESLVFATGGSQRRRKMRERWLKSKEEQ